MSTFNTGIESDLSIGRLGKPGGFAKLGSDGKVLPEQLPAANQGAPIQDSYTISRLVLNEDLDLTPTDNIKIHIVDITFINAEVNLPTSPINGTTFIIKLSSNSSNNFTINSSFINPGETYEISFDGVEWVEF